MTNATIILNESFRLMREGILSGSGRYVVLDGENGPEKVELPEDIHTFASWKARGYIVRKGEHAIAAFHVWKYSDRRRADTENGDTDGEQENGGRCFLKRSFFLQGIPGGKNYSVNRKNSGPFCTGRTGRIKIQWRM